MTVKQIDTEKLLARVRELEFQKAGSAKRWDQIIRSLAAEYLKRHDPVEKATRVLRRKVKKDSARAESKVSKSKRKPMRAFIIHMVNNRDKGQCQARGPSGGLCLDRMWTDVHHIVPISHGGSDHISNLITLCRAHHRMVHKGMV